MINLWDYEAFSKSQSDFKHTSYDSDNEVWLSDSEYDEVVSLDDTKADIDELKDFMSMDALSKINQQLYFVEFKNQKIDHFLRKEIIDKANGSVNIYCSVTRESFMQVIHEYECIVVYAKKKNSSRPYGVKQIEFVSNSSDLSISSMRVFGDYFLAKAKTEIVRFGMHEMQGRYFRAVHTYDEKRFARFLRDNGILV